MLFRSGELRSTDRPAEIVKDRKQIKTTLRSWEIRVSLVKKLEQPESSREENLDAEPITEDDAA